MPSALAVRYADSKSAALTASWALDPILLQISLFPFSPLESIPEH
jgi:hypothetical protein